MPVSAPARREGLEVQGVRVILSDTLVNGGQKVKTVHSRPLSISDVVALMFEHFNFEELISQHGLVRKSLGAENLHIVGFDGTKRVILKNDTAFVEFFTSLQQTKLPTLDVQIVSGSGEGGRKRQREPHDRVEQLEDENYRLATTAQRLERRVEELERLRMADRDEAQRMVTLAEKEQNRRADADKQAFQAEIKKLQTADASLMQDVKSIRDHIAEIEKKEAARHQELTDSLEEFNLRTAAQFEDVDAGMAKLRHETVTETARLKKQRDDDMARLQQQRNEDVKQRDEAVSRLQRQRDGDMSSIQKQRDEDMSSIQKDVAELRAADSHINNELNAKEQALQEQLAKFEADEMSRYKATCDKIEHLTNVKVDVAHHDKTTEDFHTRVTDETTRLHDKVDKLEEANGTSIEQVIKDYKLAVQQATDDFRSADNELSEKLDNLSSKTNREVARVEAAFKSGDSELNKKMKALHNEIRQKIEVDLRNLTESTESRFSLVNQEMSSKDKAMSKRVDILGAQTEKTFRDMNERIEEMMKKERARLNSLDQRINEECAKIRFDCRSEIDRVRTDYEQEAARLDGDLNDLHTKHDVTKQEINFFQSRLLEQREWAQRQFIETTTATRAAQVDAQEGVSAATKMLHALRDDQVTFRDKMAKHISLLQHASDSHGDALGTLELQRGRMKMELEALLQDHKAYTLDMDGWADDVRVKVERLFRSMEPPKAEWRVNRAGHRGKELKKPLAMKSPCFALMGLRRMEMEFFPNGHGNSPEGWSVVRLLMPPASVRYQVYVGGITEGSRDYESQEASTIDLFFEKDWRDEIRGDGSLQIKMEVLRDNTNNDQTLAHVVHLESH